MRPSRIVLETQYFPSTSYFVHLLNAEEALIEAHENYQKQSHRNRCYILTANKVDLLTVPIIHGKGKKIPIQEVEIDYSQKWQNRHWRAIESAYAQAPFFEHYADTFKGIIYSDEKFLFQLNQQVLKVCLQFLGISQYPKLTSTFQKPYSDSGISDMRGKISYKAPFLEHFKPYYQVFGVDFEKNLSIIDLLFCEGPQSKLYL